MRRSVFLEIGKFGVFLEDANSLYIKYIPKCAGYAKQEVYYEDIKNKVDVIGE